MIGRTEHTIRVNLHRELLIKLWTDGLDFKRKFQKHEETNCNGTKPNEL